MKALDKILGDFEARVAKGLLTTLSTEEAMELWDLVNESREAVSMMLNSPGLKISLRLIQYEGVIHRLRDYGYVRIVQDGEALDGYYPLSINAQVSITPEGKSFFEQTYLVPK